MVVLLSILCHLVLNLLGLENLLGILPIFVLRAVSAPNLICIFIIELSMLIVVSFVRLVVMLRHLRRIRAFLIDRASNILLASHHIVILILLGLGEYGLCLIIVFLHFVDHIFLLFFLVLLDRVRIILFNPIFVWLVFRHLICEIIALIVLHFLVKLKLFILSCCVTLKKVSSFL